MAGVIFSLELIALFAEALALLWIVTYRPSVYTDAWGNPDAGEATGYCCLICIVSFIDLILIGLTLYAIGVTLNV